MFESADLLGRLRTTLNVPAQDEWAEQSVLYQCLGDAQMYWQRQLALHVPELVAGPVVKLVTTDNIIWSLPSSAGIPLGRFEVYDTEWLESSLRRGASNDPSADFHDFSPTQIRVQRFGGIPYGLWARVVPMTDVINDSNQPTILFEARELLVPRAAAIMAQRGGERDPSPYLAYEQTLAWGNPLSSGDAGIIGTLKARTQTIGSPSDQGSYWWRRVGR